MVSSAPMTRASDGPGSTTSIYSSFTGQCLGSTPTLRRGGEDAVVFIVTVPVGLRIAIEISVEQGRVGAIGVSNFKRPHLERIVAATGRVPDVNQIQLSADLARDDIRDLHKRWGIVTEAWSPLGRGGPLLTHPVVVDIADRVGRTPAQVLLRWHVQHNIVPIPRADDPRQLRENAQIFDFNLTHDDLAELRNLDRGESAARDSDSKENGH